MPACKSSSDFCPCGKTYVSFSIFRSTVHGAPSPLQFICTMILVDLVSSLASRVFWVWNAGSPRESRAMRPQQPAQDTVLTKRGDGLVDISPVDLLTHRKHFWVAECAGGLVDPGGGGVSVGFQKKILDPGFAPLPHCRNIERSFSSPCVKPTQQFASFGGPNRIVGLQMGEEKKWLVFGNEKRIQNIHLPTIRSFFNCFCFFLLHFFLDVLLC